MTSSPEPPGNFQPDLAQYSLRLTGLSFFQMKDLALFLKGDNSNKLKIYWQLLKIYPRTSIPISTKHDNKVFLGKRELKFVQLKGHAFFQGEIIATEKIHWRLLKIFYSRTTWPISTKFDTEYPWVKSVQTFCNEGSHLTLGGIKAK